MAAADPVDTRMLRPTLWRHGAGRLSDDLNESLGDEPEVLHCGSERQRLNQDVSVPFEQTTLRDDVDPGSEQLLEVRDQMELVQQGSARFELDQQVHVACSGRLFSGDRTEHAHITCTPIRCDVQNGFAHASQVLQVHGHGHSVIHRTSRIQPTLSVEGGTAAQPLPDQRVDR